MTEVNQSSMHYQVRPTTVDPVLIHDEKILLVKRAKPPYKGSWVLPGGYIDWNETAEQAVVRELWEETGVRSKVIRQVGVYSDPKRDPRQTIAVAFLLKRTGGRLKRDMDETKDVRWFSLAKLPKLGFDHKKIVRDALKELRKR